MSLARNCLTPLAFLALSSGAFAMSLNTLLANETGSACWYRAYTEQHLREHPNQQVTAMAFTMTYREDNEFALGEFVFQLDATLRDGRRGTAIGPCSMEGASLKCGVECDGGGVYVTDRGGERVLIDLERRGYIAMTSGCGGADFEEGFALEPGLDDKQFLLSSLLPQFCMPVEY